MRNRIGFLTRLPWPRKPLANCQSANRKPFILTLDGPAAVGKSSVACRVAQDLNLAYLDSGSLYRTVALLFQRAHPFEFAPDPISKLNAGCFDLALTSILDHFAEHGRYQVNWLEDRPRVLFSQEDIETAIRREENGRLTSLISQRPIVRERLLGFQHQFVGEHGRAIAVGRDAGSIVFPDANLKIFLTASVKVRAHRRWLELRATDPGVTLRAVAAAIFQRDAQDRQRVLAPLVVPQGAKKISTSRKTLVDVVQQIKDLMPEDEGTS